MYIYLYIFKVLDSVSSSFLAVVGERQRSLRRIRSLTLSRKIKKQKLAIERLFFLIRSCVIIYVLCVHYEFNSFYFKIWLWLNNIEWEFFSLFFLFSFRLKFLNLWSQLIRMENFSIVSQMERSRFYNLYILIYWLLRKKVDQKMPYTILILEFWTKTK